MLSTRPHSAAPAGHAGLGLARLRERRKPEEGAIRELAASMLGASLPAGVSERGFEVASFEPRHPNRRLSILMRDGRV